MHACYFVSIGMRILLMMAEFSQSLFFKGGVDAELIEKT